MGGYLRHVNIALSQMFNNNETYKSFLLTNGLLLLIELREQMIRSGLVSHSCAACVVPTPCNHPPRQNSTWNILLFHLFLFLFDGKTGGF